jgi:flagellar motor switch protein FliM
MHGSTRANTQHAGKDATDQTIRPHDFAATRAAAALGVNSLNELNTAFAADLSASLSQHLRGTVDIAFQFAEEIRYDDFLHSLGEVSCLSVLRIEPPGAQACLDLGLPIIYPIIDRLLGGPASSDTPSIPLRPLTQIESGLALQVIERAAGALMESWSRIAPLEVREESLESSPAELRLMPGDEIVTVARFDVRLGSGGSIGGGTMSLCVPAPVIRYLSDVPPTAPSLAERDNARDTLRGNLLQSAVELRALLAQTKLRLSDVLNMQVGDVITTDAGATDEMPIQVEGRDKFHGRVGQLRGTRAMEITRGPDTADPPQAPERKT